MDRYLNRINEAAMAADRIINMVESAGFDITNPYSIIDNADYTNTPADMRYSYGASRLVIWDEDYCDYVVKIALNESYEKYCQHEVEVYEAAVKEGLADSFAWCMCYAEPCMNDDFYNPGIYVMEYVDCNEDCNADAVWEYGYNQYCSERGLDSSNYDHADEYNNWSYDGVDEELTLDYVESYVPGELIRAFVVFMSKWHITDIHTSNIGYIGNRIVMLDYAGWNWQKGGYMNPAMIIIVILVGVGVWFALARKDVFTKTEDFIDESIEMGIPKEDNVDIECEVK